MAEQHSSNVPNMETVIKNEIKQEYIPCEYETDQEKETSIGEQHLQAKVAEHQQLFLQLSDIINSLGGKYKEEHNKGNDVGKEPQTPTSSNNTQNIICVGKIYLRTAPPNRIIIGPNGTQITEAQFRSISWKSETNATRELLKFVFGDHILATHTLSGKPSPAFHGRERPQKNPLDSNKVADIIHLVRFVCNCPSRVIRLAITTKCADSAKKIKRFLK